LFRELIKVSGVGPKMALGILSGMERGEFVSCVMNNDLASLVKVPGVGKKTAERLMVEMRDRLKGWAGAQSGTESGSEAIAASMGSSLTDEAESALMALGYKPAEAAKAIKQVLKDHQVSRSEELIRLALKSMMPGR